MEVVEFVEYFDRYDDDDNRVIRRPRIIRNRLNYFEQYDEQDFFRRFRMSKVTTLYILHQIDHQLEYRDDRNTSISPIIQLLITLRFCATGCHLLSVADYSGVSISSACRIVRKVCTALVQLRRRYIKFPSTNNEKNEIKHVFFQIGGFPNVVGTIDCTHVKIQSPGGDDAELFRNRKGYFSINVQTVSDANLKILNVIARWPGSTHDSAIFQNSGLCFEFETNVHTGCYLLGDNGYPLRNYLLTPYLNPQNIHQQNYNIAHIRTRNTVERQYGVLKRRFPVLALGLRLKLNTAINVILACTVLHNICIDENEDIPPQEIENLEEMIENGQIEQIQNENAHRNLPTRDFIANTYF